MQLLTVEISTNTKKVIKIILSLNLTFAHRSTHYVKKMFK